MCVRAEPVWDPATHDRSWRAVWAYSAKRAARDGKTLTLQENRAKAVIAGEKAAKTSRFVTIRNGSKTLDEASLARARRLVGLKGYVSNIPAEVMPPTEVIASYHDLWHVEQSFRMIQDRPAGRAVVCAHQRLDRGAPDRRDDRPGHRRTPTISNRDEPARDHPRAAPLCQVTVRIAGQTILAEPQLTPEAERILTATTH